jgi:hypothetical protein
MVERFTKEQLTVLAHIHRNRWALVAGCTGSGKTVLAMETAQRMERDGQKVLILCYSPFLAKSLRARLQGSDIRVSDFNTFVHTILKNPEQPEMAAIPTLGRTQGLRPKYDRPWNQFDEPTEYELNVALSRMLNSTKRFDAVIVDEGQDFKKEWWDLVEGCLSDVHTGRLVIFYDDNQAIYRFSVQPSTQLGTQRYADLALAPIVLARDCRNGGDIFDLVQQLHPKSPMMQDSLAGEGQVREWVFNSQAELFKQIREALAAAESVSTKLKDFVVLSAENVFIQQSKLNGTIFNAPWLSASGERGQVNWQKGVMQYLRRFGFIHDQLSQGPFPNADDVRKVNQFCDAYFNQHRTEMNRQIGYLAQYTLSWSMDYYGEIHLHWKQDAKLEIPERDLLFFFSSPTWFQMLPPAHRRYRLTPLEDFPDHPEYENIRLVDIPSFRGLEAEGVIFVFYNYFAEDKFKLLASLYSGMSRARQWLYIVTPYSLLG